MILCFHHDLLTLVLPIQKLNTLGLYKSFEVVISMDDVESDNEEGFLVVDTALLIFPNFQ
jgi:hypothetical protein